jgi:threonine/homoserine efflux transporter RhtA
VAARVPPHVYFVVSAVFHYLGPAFAVLLFARVDVLGVAWHLLTGVELGGEPLGVALAFANALLFTAYVVLAPSVARHGALGGIDGSPPRC